MLSNFVRALSSLSIDHLTGLAPPEGAATVGWRNWRGTRISRIERVRGSSNSEVCHLESLRWNLEGGIFLGREGKLVQRGEEESDMKFSHALLACARNAGLQFQLQNTNDSLPMIIRERRSNDVSDQYRSRRGIR